MNETLLDLDVRGLEPPEPLVRILGALSAAAPGTVVRAFTDRRPMHLYDQLARRGYTGETTPQSDGSFLTIIRHG